mgnify:CR=1 FL=1
MALFRQTGAVGKHDQTRLIGDKELSKMFASLPKRIKNDKIWNKFWREVSKPLIKEAKARVPKKTQQLKKSIGYFRTKKSKQYHGAYVGPRVKGTWASPDKTGFYGPFVAYGGVVNFWGKGTGEFQMFMEPAWRATKVQIEKDMLKMAEKTMASLIKSDAKRLKKLGHFGY